MADMDKALREIEFREKINNFPKNKAADPVVTVVTAATATDADDNNNNNNKKQEQGEGVF
jgi:hypothetical protein